MITYIYLNLHCFISFDHAQKKNEKKSVSNLFTFIQPSRKKYVSKSSLINQTKFRLAYISLNRTTTVMDGKVNCWLLQILNIAAPFYALYYYWGVPLDHSCPVLSALKRSIVPVVLH